MIDFDRLVKPGFGVEGQDSMLLLFGTVLKTSLFYMSTIYLKELNFWRHFQIRKRL